MRLYGFANSMHTWKVRALARHLDVAMDYVQVDLLSGENKQPAFLAINPTGRTPALVDGDLTLIESNAMLQWVASQRPTPLYPDDARSRAAITNWMSWQGHHLSKACEPLLFENLVKELYGIGGPDPAVVARTEPLFHVEARLIDDHLARRAFLVDDTLTIADFSAASYFLHAERGRFPMAPYAHIRRWTASVLALPCWAATAP